MLMTLRNKAISLIAATRVCSIFSTGDTAMYHWSGEATLHRVALGDIAVPLNLS